MSINVNGNQESGENLRVARREAGLSQQALAERAHCSLSMVRLFERGYEPESGEVLDRVLAVLSPDADATTGQAAA